MTEPLSTGIQHLPRGNSRVLNELLSASGCVKQSLRSDLFEMALFAQGLLVLLFPGIAHICTKMFDNRKTKQKDEEFIKCVRLGLGLGHRFLFVSFRVFTSRMVKSISLCTSLHFVFCRMVGKKSEKLINELGSHVDFNLRFGIDLGFQQWPWQQAAQMGHS